MLRFMDRLTGSFSLRITPYALRSAEGFTLLEVMLSLSLIAGGTVAVMELFQRAQMGAADGENVLIATHLAQRRLEELRNTSYASLASEAEAQVTSPSGLGRFCREATVSEPSSNLKQVVLAVSWGPPDCLTSSTVPSLTLQTYRSAD